MEASMNKKEQTLKTFNRQAKVYDHSMFSKHAKKLYPKILDTVIKTDSLEILDLGCGTGELMKLLLENNDRYQLTGIDLSSKMIEIANEKLANRVKLVIGDSENLPFDDNSFDLVYCNDSFHHYVEVEQVIKEISRVLKKDGYLIIGDLYQTALIRKIFNFLLRFNNEGDVHVYSKKEMISLLRPHFKQIEFERIGHDGFMVKGVVIK